MDLMYNLRIEERETTSSWMFLISPLFAIIISLLLAGFLILLAGVSPIESYLQLFIGAFGSKNALAETLSRATPLILTGLAAGIAFKAKFWTAHVV